MAKMTQGYLFIANGESYAQMLKSYTIPSIRHFDKVRPMTILTTTPEFFDASVHTILPYDAEYYKNRYAYLNPSQYFLLGTIPKLIIFDITPYDETLYLDADIINMKDINTFWDACSSQPKNVFISGGSDDKNNAPSHWHWNTIQEVIDATGLHIPRINGGAHYWRKKGDFMSIIEPYLKEPERYKIKPWFRGSYVDEIFISIYLGIKEIHPDTDEDASPPNPASMQTYRTSFVPAGNAQFFHCFNKDVLPEYFRYFLDKYPSFSIGDVLEWT